MIASNGWAMPCALPFIREEKADSKDAAGEDANPTGGKSSN